MIKITGLYKSISKKGDTFLSGKTIDGVKYFVFKNNKKKDNHPDYNLYMEDNDTNPQKPKIETTDDFLNQQVDSDDDLPF
ncbi:MAG: hypothetical protein KGZ97_01565 [Bacteroidetes bacterium]|nr:hypothetical protein [Bacteroidota bacterium]